MMATENRTHEVAPNYRAAISSIHGTVRIAATLGSVKVRIDAEPAELAPGAARLLAAELMAAATAAEQQGATA